METKIELTLKYYNLADKTYELQCGNTIAKGSSIGECVFNIGYTLVRQFAIQIHGDRHGSNPPPDHAEKT